MKSANSKGEIWMVTDRRQVADLTAACLNASAQVSTILIREKDWSLTETADFCHSLLDAFAKIGEGPSPGPYPSQPSAVPQLILNWNGTFDPSGLPIQGIHLGFDVARQLAASGSKETEFFQQKKPLWKIGASVHSAEEWEALRSLSLHYVLLSNVFTTSCKPDKAGLGLSGLKTLFELIQKDKPAIQAYALGGLKNQDLESVSALGLQGVVLRSAFF